MLRQTCAYLSFVCMCVCDCITYVWLSHHDDHICVIVSCMCNLCAWHYGKHYKSRVCLHLHIIGIHIIRVLLEWCIVHTQLFVYDVSHVCLQLALHMCSVSRVPTHVCCVTRHGHGHGHEVFILATRVFTVAHVHYVTKLCAVTCVLTGRKDSNKQHAVALRMWLST